MRALKWSVSLCLLAAGFAAGWASHRVLEGPPQDVEDEGDAAVAPADMAVPVRVGAVESGPFGVEVAALGLVRATASGLVALTSRLGGRAVEVPVVVGQRVAAGDLVVRFDAAPGLAAVAEARAEHDGAAAALAGFDRGGRAAAAAALEVAAAQARATADLASQQLARVESLRGDGLVAEKSLIEARRDSEQRALERAAADGALATFRDSGAELERARLEAAAAAAAARLSDAEARLADAEVRAPAAGELTRLGVRAGQSCDPQLELAELLVGPDRRVELGVAPADAARVAVGAPARCDVGAGDIREGVVESIGGVVDAATGLVPVVVRLADEAPALRIGLAVHGALEVERRADVLIVPEPAIVRESDRTVVVQVSADDRARIVPVRVLARRDGRAAIEGDVHGGDRVIVEGAFNLPDGAHVVVESDAEQRR